MDKGSSDQFDLLIKLLVVGNSGVGKTCLLVRLSEDLFIESHLATIGIDFKIKTIDVDGKRVKLQIVGFRQWDTAGQERFRTITQTYYTGAMGAIIAYDCTDEGSFRDVREWLEQVRSRAKPGIALVLIGNKCDRPDRRVTKGQGEALAKELGMKFFECSAKSNIGVMETFQYLGRELGKEESQETLPALRVRRWKPGKRCCSQ